MIQSESLFAGPLPPPDVLRQYEKVCPGLTQILIDAWGEESEHRRRLERETVQAEIEDRRASRREKRLGQWLGFGVAMGSVALSIVLAFCNAPVVASLVGGTTLVSLVAIFVLGRVLMPGKSGDIEPDGD